jgi:hypothetical protein
MQLNYLGYVPLYSTAEADSKATVRNAGGTISDEDKRTGDERIVSNCTFA